MKYLTAWEAHTGSVHKWLQSLLDSDDAQPTDIVWRGPDGGYAVHTGGGWPDEEDGTAEYIDSGTVQEWLDEK